MEALTQLRAADVERRLTEMTRLEVSEQFEHITKLRMEKELLAQRLQLLMDGSSLPKVNEDENLEIGESRQTLAALKEKISAHQILGPCGLTVLDVNEKTLVVTFTAIWKNLTQSFVLKMTLINNSIKMAGTDIPHFMDMSKLLENCSIDDLPDKMDIISSRLSDFIRRKREVLYVEDEFKDVLTSITYDQSFTSVDMEICLPCTDNDKMTVHLWYANIDDIFPENVDFTFGSKVSVVSRNLKSDFYQLFKEMPLSSAFPSVMDRLRGERERRQPEGTIKEGRKSAESEREEDTAEIATSLNETGETMETS